MQRTHLQGITLQSWIVDYPLIAYNSFLPENSEIVLSNFAEKEKYSQYIHLGSQWSFISFVKTACLNEVISGTEPQSCQILFLAKHKIFTKYRLILLEQNPWLTPNERKCPDIKVSIVYTSEILNLPPRPLEQLKSLHLLSNLLTKESKMGE